MKRTGLIGLAVLLLVAIAIGVTTYGAPLPKQIAAAVASVSQPLTVSAEMGATLDKAVLMLENQQLRVALAQAEVRALLASAEKPNYVLGRDASGKWVYTPKTPTPKDEKQ